VTGPQTRPDEEIREQLRAAVAAIDGALAAIASVLAPLKPALRNELIQRLGDRVERARVAKASLERLLAEVDQRAEGAS
jgi:ABC-type transporter Mla subunit MlaD